MRRADRYFLALDIGGSRVRCAVVDPSGRVAGQSASAWSPSTPEELAPVGKEIDAEALWRLVARLVRRALKEAGARPTEIAAAGVTSQRQGIAVLDARGRELYAGPNSDARAFFEGQAIDEEHGEEVYRVTGHTPALLLAPAKLRWLQQHRPRDFGRARAVLTLDAWASFRLSGELACERAAAAEAGLVDVVDGSLASGLLAKLGLSSSIVPRLVSSGQRVGSVTREAAAATGLAEGTPVVAAGPDTQCALLGMGATRPGQTGIVAGSTAPVQMVLDRRILDERRRTWSGLHVVPGRWVLESTTTEAGTAYGWLVSLLFGGGTPGAFAAAGRLAARAPRGSDAVLAYLGPRLADMRDLSPRWGGVLFPVPFIGGPADHGRILRAALENLVFAVKANIAQLESIAGGRASEVWLSGGMAQGGTLARILADVLGAEVRLPRTLEASVLGAAMAAAAGAGIYCGLEEASRAMGRRARIVRPDPLAALEYQEHYQRWAAVGEGLRGLSEHL